MALKIGDVVKLKSGGARMVVAETGYDDNEVRCVWHNDTGKGYEEKSALYPEAILEEVKDKPPGASVGVLKTGL